MSDGGSSDIPARPHSTDPLSALSPAGRRAVLERFLEEAHTRLRELLAAAVAGDHGSAVRLATGLAADAAAVGQEDAHTAALALAHAAEERADLGAPVLALTRALAASAPPT